jgi:hypothetical protein
VKEPEGMKGHYHEDLRKDPGQKAEKTTFAM